MTTNNKDIKEFIKYYCELGVSPEYALLIKGAWGCGKSHLVRECIANIEDADKTKRFLYVSLYGVSCVDDIETKFFQLLNPVLSSKGMILAGRLAKGLLRGALKLDLDGDGKADASLSVGTPDINLNDYLTDTKNCILVFDDLERCSIELKQVLGYINYFVEMDGYKVILVADEEKLNAIHKSQDVSGYKYVKEKLIGKTLEVEPNIGAVFDKLLNETASSDNLKEILAPRKERIIHIFKCAKYRNLRSLRKTLLEFDRLLIVLEEEVKLNDKLISHLLNIFIILSLEIYSGELLAEEINSLIGSSCISRSMQENKGKEGPPNKFSVIERKYDLSLYETILEVSEWICIFTKGSIDAERVNETLKKSNYFSKEHSPDWIKLWHHFDLEDAEFIRLYESVRSSFDAREYFHPGEIKHISGMFLRFSKKNLINKDKSEILRDCVLYIDEVFAKSLVIVDESTHEQVNSFGSFAGLGYMDIDSDEFGELSKYLNEKIQSAFDGELENRSGEILQAMKQDPEHLYTLLCHSNYKENAFYYHPILHYIDSAEFILQFQKIPNKAKRIVVDALFTRYTHRGLNDPVLVERDWLKKVHEGFGAALNKGNVTISTLAFEYACSRLGDSLKTLEGLCSSAK